MTPEQLSELREWTWQWPDDMPGVIYVERLLDEVERLRAEVRIHAKATPLARGLFCTCGVEHSNPNGHAAHVAAILNGTA